MSQYSLDFGGVDGSVSVGTPGSGLSDSLWGTGADFSVSLWFKCGTAAPYDLFSWYYAGGGDPAINFRITANEPSLAGTVLVHLSSFVTYKAFTSGAWNHCAVVRTSGILAIWVDGVQEPFTGSVATDMNNNSAALTFGSPGFLDGNLDEIAVFTSALSGANIVGLANGTVDVGTLSPSGLWRLEEGAGTSTADTSGNGNNGTLVNGVTWSTDVPWALVAGSAFPFPQPPPYRYNRPKVAAF